MCIRTSKSYPNIKLGDILEYVSEVKNLPTCLLYTHHEDFFVLKNEWGTMLHYPKENFQTTQTIRHDKLTELGI